MAMQVDYNEYHIQQGDREVHGVPERADRPVLTLVVATVQRPELLSALLHSLVQHGTGDAAGCFEVIVVDQSGDDGTRAVVASFEGRLPVTYLRQATRSAARARNFGASAARGVWLGFPDDDCQFLPDTLRHLLRRLATADSGASRLDLIAGMTRDEQGRPSVLRWQTHEGRIGPANLRRTLAESTTYLRRELFFSVGGFDPAFGPGGRFAAEEGVDLVRRVWSSSPEAVMLFSPQICLRHPPGAPYQDEAAVRKARLYACARGACFARHWSSSSYRRIASEVARHLVGSIVFSGLRRRSRIVTLAGYVEGFSAYVLWRLGEPRPQAAQESLETGLAGR